MKKRTMRPVIHRFMEKIDKNGPIVSKKLGKCWLWTGARDGQGRGYISIEKKSRRAHRVSYELFIGKIEGGLMVCHSCDTPFCVNPKHLWTGTNADNMSDMGRKKRSKFHKTKFFGSTHGMSKLTEKDVAGIRSRYIKGENQFKTGNSLEIRKEFKISATNLSAIIRRKIWKHIP